MMSSCVHRKPRSALGSVACTGLCLVSFRCVADGGGSFYLQSKSADDLLKLHHKGEVKVMEKIGIGCFLITIVMVVAYAFNCLIVWLVWELLAASFDAVASPTTNQVMLVGLVTIIILRMVKGGLARSK